MSCNNNEYNQYKQLPQMPYNIVSYLLLNNNDIWKLLYYTESNALDRTNITIDEKKSLIYNGESISDNKRVFFQPFTDDAFTEPCALLRVYPVTIIPENSYIGIVDFAIEIMSHVKINQLNNYSTRILTMLQQVIETLNGVNINGIGNMFFDKKGSYGDVARLNIYNNRNYLGYTVVLSTKTA